MFKKIYNKGCNMYDWSHPISFIHISFGLMEGLGCCFLVVAKLDKGVNGFQTLPSLICLPPLDLLPLLGECMIIKYYTRCTTKSRRMCF